MDYIKLAQRTIAMLSSMIESGECHTTRSKEMKDNALNGLEQLRIAAVIKSLPDSDEIRMKAREFDEKDFDQWWWETVYKGNVL